MKKGKKKISNTTIYNIINLNYDASYEKLRTTPNKNIQSLDKSNKGHIVCWVKEPYVFVEISPKGKMNIYYDRYDDLNKVIRILEKLVVCNGFSIERDVPRTLKVVQEVIEASADDKLEPLSSGRLKHDNHLLAETPKTFNDATKGMHEKYMNGFGAIGAYLVKFAADSQREAQQIHKGVDICTRKKGAKL
jgi:hypothetical protein